MARGYGKDLPLLNDAQLLDNQSNRKHTRERISMSHGGKGDKPRPLSVSKEQFDKNFDAIFGKVKIKLYGVEIEKTQEELDNLFKIEKNDTRD